MHKMFLRAIFIACIAVSTAWCVDNVVITGTITDSVNHVPAIGIRVYSNGLLSGGTLAETTTDATGKYVLVNSGTIPGSTTPITSYGVSTSYPMAYQYATTGLLPVPAVNRTDNIPDTFSNVNLNVGSVTNPPDTIVIKGTVADSNKALLKNIKVEFRYLINDVFYPVPPSGLSFQSDSFRTDANGVFYVRRQNYYGTKAGTFSIAYFHSAPFDSAQNTKYKLLTKVGFVGNDSAHTSIRDGKEDTIAVNFALIPPPTIVSNNFQKPLAKSPNLQTTPVNVSIYSIDGRLVRKISNVKLETLDNTLASLNLHGGKVLFAVWNQNGMKCSKRIMNLRKNNF